MDKGNRDDTVCGAVIVALPMWEFTQFVWWI